MMAYQVLASTRTSNGFGANPLSLLELKAYLDLTGPPYLPVPIFMELIQRLDLKHLSLMQKETKKGGRAS